MMVRSTVWRRGSWLPRLWIAAASWVFLHGGAGAAEEAKPLEPRQEPVVANDVLNKKISVDFRKARLGGILDEAGAKTGLKTAYERDADFGFEWTYSAEGEKACDVIGRMCEAGGLGYSRSGNLLLFYNVADRRTRRILREKRISFNFAGVRVRDAVKFMGATCGARFVLNASEKSCGQRMTLRVETMNVDLALEWICRLTGLKWHTTGGAVVITEQGAPIPLEGKGPIAAGRQPVDLKRPAVAALIEGALRGGDIPGGTLQPAGNDTERELVENLQLLFRPDTGGGEGAYLKENCLKMVGYACGDAVLPYARRLTGSGDPQARVEAIRAMADVGPKGAAELLIRALDDEDRRVRQEAMKGLARLQGSRALAHVGRFYEVPDGRMDVDTLETAAVSMAVDELVPFAVSRVGADPNGDRTAALIILARTKSDRSAEGIVKLYESRLIDVTLAAVMLLNVGTEKAWAKARELMQSESFGISRDEDLVDYCTCCLLTEEFTAGALRIMEETVMNAGLDERKRGRSEAVVEGRGHPDANHVRRSAYEALASCRGGFVRDALLALARLDSSSLGRAALYRLMETWPEHPEVIRLMEEGIDAYDYEETPPNL